MGDLRTRVLRTLELPGVARGLSSVLRNRATVFVLHRLKDPERGIHGSQPEAIRAALAFLRRERFEIVTLEEIVRRSLHGEPSLRGAVAFTLDDGYAEQGLPVASLFSEFDCPATIFVTTGFLDGELWMWWDKVEYILRRTEAQQLSVELGGQDVALVWADEAGLLREQGRFLEACKAVEDAEKHLAIARLARAADVELTNEPPPEYAPMSWEDLRASERKGMQFGPHTVTHPILSRTQDAAARAEISGSWNRLRTEATGAVPIFCYPNGQVGDFGEREYALLRELGIVAAVTGFPGYVRHCSPEDPGQPFQLQRYPLSDRLGDVLQYASGIERLKDMVRGAAR